MSYEEYTHWAVIYRHEPFGEYRADIRAADVLVMLANVNRNPKKQNAFGPKDFLRNWWQEHAPAKPQDGKTLFEKFRTLTMGMKADGQHD